MKTPLKTAARGVALVIAAPALVSFWCRAAFIGRDEALHTSTQTLGMLPGLTGRYVRVAFLRCVLDACDPSATIEFGTVFSQAGARIGPHAYIGPGCHIGLADIGRDVLIGAGVHVPSGPETHGTRRVDVPIREQPGARRLVRIGDGSWIGSASVVMADVGAHSIVGAGSVVVKAVPPFSVVAGVPAAVIRDRRAVRVS